MCDGYNMHVSFCSRTLPAGLQGLYDIFEVFMS